MEWWWRRRRERRGFVGKKERAGRQVGRPGMFEHSRGKKALLEFKVKNFPPPTPGVVGR